MQRSNYNKGHDEIDVSDYMWSQHEGDSYKSIQIRYISNANNKQCCHV